VSKRNDTPATDALRQHLSDVGTDQSRWSETDRTTYNQLSNDSAYETADQPMGGDR
jgi:hypothetical protein